MAAKAKCEWVEVVNNVRCETLEVPGHPTVGKADAVFRVHGKGEAGKAYHWHRTFGTTGRLRADDRDFVACSSQVTNQIQRAIDDAVYLGQEDFRNNGNTHGYASLE